MGQCHMYECDRINSLVPMPLNNTKPSQADGTQFRLSLPIASLPRPPDSGAHGRFPVHDGMCWSVLEALLSRR